MTYDKVSNYTFNRYQGQCNCTCRQSQTVNYNASPALFNFGFPFNFNCTPASFTGFNLVNPFFFELFNPLMLFNNANLNFSLPNPFNFSTDNLNNTLPLTTPQAFGNLTMPAPTLSTTPGTKSKSSPGITTSSIAASSARKATLLKDVDKNDTNFAEQLKEKGVQYNAELGHNLAKYTINHTTGETGRCAHYVNNALEEYNINAKRDNHAYTRANVLAADNNFTEIEIKSETDLKSLPAGSVVVYDKGACNYSDEHGHVFIATGNGGAGSDHLQNSIKFGSGVRAFIPTKTSDAIA